MLIQNEAPRSKLRGIKAKLRRSQPAFALKSFGAVRHAIHPCSKLQGILAKANKTTNGSPATRDSSGLLVDIFEFAGRYVLSRGYLVQGSRLVALSSYWSMFILF